MDTPQEKLKKLTAWDTEPALTEDELDELLISSSLEDKEGRAAGRRRLAADL